MYKTKEQKSAYNKKYRQDNLEKFIKYKKNWDKNNKDLYEKYVLKRRYGLTMEELKELINSQNGYCYICGRHESSFKGKRRLHLDHCHKTGKVRKLLCIRCNNALGFLDDNIERLEKCISYLKDHN